MRSLSPVLVTGATGRHGGTGPHVVRRLLEEGHQVRVLARRPSDRTRRLRAQGVEVIHGDLHDRRSVAAAVQGVDLAYFTYPIDAGVITAAANYAAAVREIGHPVRTVVMSMGPAHPDHPSDRGRDQWLAEEVLAWAGLDVLVLRVVAAFHENLALLHAGTVSRHGVIRNCFGDALVPWLSGADAGELAVSALLHPERFDGPVCFPPGAEQADHTTVAALIGAAIGRSVRYEPVDRDTWRQELVQLAETDPTGLMNRDMAGHISAVAAAMSDHGPARPADADRLRALLGREPVSLSEFLAANRHLFASGRLDAASGR